MQKIIPFLWYDKEALEAAELYTSVFGGKIKGKAVLEDTPSGSVQNITIDLFGQEFQMMSAGPLFKFNPSISFMVLAKSKEEVDEYWNKLSPGGTVLMPLDAYPFSPRYGWIQDKFGLSWQIAFMGDYQVNQRITSTLMFVGDVYGKAEEAMNFYVSVFKDARIGGIMKYGEGEDPDKAGNVKHASLLLENQEFSVMDSARMHDFKFNEAISHMIMCKDQAEIDYYWEKLSAVPASEQCGWLKDKFGVSWQVVPEVMNEMMASSDREAVNRVTQVFLKMKKFDLAELQKAFEDK